MATLRVGCTGFSAGAASLVSERATNPQCTGTGLHRLKPVLRRWFCLCSSQEETGGAEVGTRPFRSSLFLHLQESTGLTRILI